MYGMEHGVLMHAAIFMGSWLAFFALCALPFLLIYVAYRAGVKRGREEERLAQQRTSGGLAEAERKH